MLRNKLALLLLCTAAAATADVRLPALISPHMLLQRDMPVHIWGKADPGEKVTVGFRGATATATPDMTGRWDVYLPPGPAGGPFELRVQGRNQLVVPDVLVGDLWVASGQSNMEWSVSRSRDAAIEIAAANYPQIRIFRVGHKISDTPVEDVEGSWHAVTPESVKEFSAVGYFFARHLNGHLKVPMGVMSAAWGGTPAEAWTSAPALAADASLQPVFANYAAATHVFTRQKARHAALEKAWEAGGEKGPYPNPPRGPADSWMPAGLFNGMIAPLTEMPVKGAIWYQGESNAGLERVGHYRRLFTTMIEDWRREWGVGDFPFLFVQLADFKAWQGSDWPALRQAQTDTLALRNTGMAVTIDIGNPTDIHPANKQDVGTRLALAARGIAYGEKLIYSGPLLRQAHRDGSAIRVWFDFCGAGLVLRGSGEGFEIAGEDGAWKPATARVDGVTLLVSSPDVAQPVRVRYAWADSPRFSLFNAEGLPASPFRTE